MQNKNLLVITDGFPQKNKYNCNFVKSYVDLVKDEFKQVFVISPQPYAPNFFQKIPYLKNFARFSSFKNYQYENVSIFYPSFLMLPISFFRKRRGNIFAEQCEKTIRKQSLKFDLIHTHFLFPSAYAGIKIKAKYNKPVIATAHGSDTYKDPFVNAFNFERAKQILEEVDLVTVSSDFMVNKIKEINPQAEKKTKLISNFVDTDLFKPQTRKENKIKKILMVGNLIESKGYLKLIPTVKSLIKVRQDFVVQIIGHGYLEPLLIRQIQENNLQDYIKLLGAKKNQDLFDYYNQADVFFFPSEAESFGIVQIEALACGVPVVAAPNEGSKFLIKDFCGFLSQNFSAQNYANLIHQVLEKKWNKNKMRNYIVDNYSREKIKNLTLEIYKNV